MVAELTEREASPTRGRGPPSSVSSTTTVPDELRQRVAGNLARFGRRAYHGGGDLRASAVAVALLANASAVPCFVLTRRAQGLSSHSGQWALPGGRIDAGESPARAALRELAEEVGLELPAGSVLGLLDDYATRSGYVITPVVVWAGAGCHLEPNPQEVSEVHLVPLAELERPDVPQLRRIPESDRPVIAVPLLGTAIHAPTAAVLYQLREVALRGRSVRVAHYDQPLFAWR